MAISYVYDTLPCFAKILSGEHAKKNHKGKVGYGYSDKREYEQLVDGLLPQFRLHFEKYSENDNDVKYPMGHVLVRRASFYLPSSIDNKHGKNEQWRFLSPDFAFVFQLVENTLKNQRPITNDDIGDVIERELLLKYGDWPGVYINNDLNRPDVIYIGESKKIADRHKGHLNSPLRLSSVLGTANKKGAVILQDLIIVHLRKAGAIPFRDDFKTEGLYKFPSGINAMEEYKKLLKDPSVSSVMRNVTREK